MRSSACWSSIVAFCSDSWYKAQEPSNLDLGPWTLELSNQAIGRAGEFCAACQFELHGVVTTHVDIYGVDLWCETPSGRRVTVQVKATLGKGTVYLNDNRTPRYYFQVRGQNKRVADVYCFVALELGLVRLLSAAELSTSQTKAYQADQFTKAVMEEDIKRYLY